MRVFIVGAIVLIVFAIIASAASTGQLFDVTWATWVSAALLSFFVDLLLGWTWAVGPLVGRQRQTQ